MPAHVEWIAEAVGTHNWVVAPRLTASLKRRGYEVAISRKRYAAIEADYERATGEEARRLAARYETEFGVSLAEALERHV